MTLLELLDLMKKRIKLVIGLPIVCTLLIGVYSFMFMPDMYTATTSMYVLTNMGSLQRPDIWQYSAFLQFDETQ